MTTPCNLKPKLILLAILTAYAMPQMAIAENKAEALELSKIEVVGTTPLPGLGTPINQVPSNVQTGSANDIDGQISLNLAEYMDNNLGSVNTSNSVGNPYQMDVSYRGFTASPILGSAVGMSVFLDGVRVNEPFGDIVNWDLIPTNAISNINLMPGSNPLFGLNTLGGALSVHTKSGSEFPGVSATASGGSWGRRAFEFEAGGVDKEKNVDYFVAGNFFKEDGWRDHSGSNVNQIFSKVGWQNDTSDLDLSVSLADNTMHGTQSLPLSMLGNPKQAYTWPDSIQNKLAMISLKGSHFIADDKLVAGNVYYRMSNANSFNSNAQIALTWDLVTTPPPTDATNVSSSTKQSGYGGSLQYSLLGDFIGHKNQFTVGASADFGRVTYNQDSVLADLIGTETVTNPSNTPLGNVRLKTTSDYYGLYATDNFALNEQWNMTLSGRYNIAKVNLSGYSDPTGDGTDLGSLNGNHEYKRFNPAIGVNYNPSKDLGLYGGYSEGMRAPTPVELSCADETRPCSLPTGFNSDPDLHMIVAKTWEGGLRGKLSPNVGWNAGVYNTISNNDIQFIATNGSAPVGYFKNVGETKRRGLELGIHGKFDALSLAVNYGYVDATYQSDFTMGSPSNSLKDVNGNIQVNRGNRIPGISKQTVKLRVSYELTSTWNIGTNVILASSQYAHGDENNQDVNGMVPGYAVMNLDTHYVINPTWRVFAKVNNVFDNQYATFGQLGQNIYTGNDEQFRTPSAPRAAWVGITYEFGRAKTAAASVDNDK